MDVFKAIETRRSIRKYKQQRIPDDLLRTILEAGRLAPSAANRQPWAVVVVRDPGSLKLLSGACNDCGFMAKCDTALVCFGDPRDRWYEIDAAIALDNMALTAWDHGVGSCFVGYFNAEHLKALLHLPPDMKVVACLTLGYPDEQPDARPRKGFDDLVFMEKYTLRGSSPPF